MKFILLANNSTDASMSPLAEGRELKYPINPKERRLHRSPLAEGRELKCKSLCYGCTAR